jgi:hypothetical protein
MLRPTICHVPLDAAAGRNWGRNANKKMVSFGFSKLIRMAVRMTRQNDAGGRILINLDGGLVADRLPRKEQKVCNAQPLDRLEYNR